MTHFLEIETVLEINEEILGHAYGLRDRGLLESAIYRPQQSAWGQDAYPCLWTKAAALFHSILFNHPFADGNKRTATMALLTFLHLNGKRVRLPENAADIIVDIVCQHTTVDDIAAWLRTL